MVENYGDGVVVVGVGVWKCVGEFVFGVFGGVVLW